MYNITVRYNKLTPEEFKGNLEKDMSPLNALDFAEQLMIFDDFGNIYSRPEFIQAHQVWPIGYHLRRSLANTSQDTRVAAHYLERVHCFL